MNVIGVNVTAERHRSVTQLCLTLWHPMIVAHQFPLSVEFSRQEYCSGLPFPTRGDFPCPGIEPTSRVSYVSCIGRQIFFLPIVPSGKPLNFISSFLNWLLLLLESNCSIVVATTIILFIFLTYIILKNVLEIFLKK